MLMQSQLTLGGYWTGFVDTPTIIGTVNEATAYFQQKMFGEPWCEADQAHQLRALVEATSILCRLRYADVTNVFTTNFTILPAILIPLNIRLGCYETALGLLSGINPDKEHTRLVVTNRDVAGTRTGYQRYSIPEYILAGVPTMSAWTLIRPFLDDNKSILLKRVS